jgi:hypothetical protein
LGTIFIFSLFFSSFFPPSKVFFYQKKGGYLVLLSPRGAVNYSGELVSNAFFFAAAAAARKGKRDKYSQETK